MVDVFISHDQNDATFAAAIANGLEARGWTCSPGSETVLTELHHQNLQTELEAAKLVIVIWSMASIANEWVRLEATLAHKQGKVFHILRPPARLPSDIEALDTHTMVGTEKDDIEALIIKLVRACAQTSEAEPRRSARRRNRKRVSQPLRLMSRLGYLTKAPIRPLVVLSLIAIGGATVIGATPLIDTVRMVWRDASNQAKRDRLIARAFEAQQAAAAISGPADKDIKSKLPDDAEGLRTLLAETGDGVLAARITHQLVALEEAAFKAIEYAEGGFARFQAMDHYLREFPDGIFSARVRASLAPLESEIEAAWAILREQGFVHGGFAAERLGTLQTGAEMWIMDNGLKINVQDFSALSQALQRDQIVSTLRADNDQTSIGAEPFAADLSRPQVTASKGTSDRVPGEPAEPLQPQHLDAEGSAGIKLEEQLRESGIITPAPAAEPGRDRLPAYEPTRDIERAPMAGRDNRAKTPSTPYRPATYSVLPSGTDGVPSAPFAESQPLANAIRDCAQCPLLIRLDPDEFVMGDAVGRGSPDEKPQRKITFRRAFYLGMTEVTFDEWEACVESGACHHRPDDHGFGRGNRPVINVSADDARIYLRWLSSRTGHNYRLPSEAEWEYAARARSDKDFFFGNDEALLCRFANGADASSSYSWANKACSDGYGASTAPVASFLPNGFGFYDMLGNVWEWVVDCWHDNYADGPRSGVAWTKDCSSKAQILRGGSYSVQPDYLRVSDRYSFEPTERLPFFGVRVARDG